MSINRCDFTSLRSHSRRVEIQAAETYSSIAQYDLFIHFLCQQHDGVLMEISFHKLPKNRYNLLRIGDKQEVKSSIIHVQISHFYL